MESISTICGLPVYRAIVDNENAGMFAVSLVDAPAVQSDFVALAAETPAMAVHMANEEKHIVHGVIMRANYPIFRRGRAGRPDYFMLFDAATIRVMAEKYLRDNFANVVDLDHDGEPVAGVNLVQWYIKDTARGVSPVGFESIEDGSLFGEFHVTNADIWDRIKRGEFRGFSLEGFFALEPSHAVHSTEKITDLLNRLKTKLCKDMTLKERIANLLATFGAATTADGVVIAWEGDEELAIGNAVYVEDENGERVPAADGEYTIENRVIVVVDGKVSEIREIEAEPAADQDADTTDTAAEEETPTADTDTDTTDTDPAEPVRDLAAELDALTARVAELENVVSDLVSTISVAAKSHVKNARETYRAQEKETAPQADKFAAAVERAKAIGKAFRASK